MERRTDGRGRRRLGACGAIAALGLLAACVDRSVADTPPAVSAGPAPAQRVAALGRLQPQDGIRRIAGPSGAVPVIAQLRVDKGDAVKQGQILAVLDTEPMSSANARRLEAELANARSELARHSELNTNRVVSDARREEWETRVHVVEAELAQARAELARAFVRSPIEGRVLYVHAREGERVGPEGIVEIGRTGDMYAIAEVFEDEVGRLRVGQRARVTSPALEEPLEGTVEWIHLKVAKQDVTGTDPAATQDARVVEVEIRLDDSRPAADLTNLQVEVEIEL